MSSTDLTVTPSVILFRLWPGTLFWSYLVTLEIIELSLWLDVTVQPFKITYFTGVLHMTQVWSLTLRWIARQRDPKSLWSHFQTLKTAFKLKKSSLENKFFNYMHYVHPKLSNYSLKYNCTDLLARMVAKCSLLRSVKFRSLTGFIAAVGGFQLACTGVHSSSRN